MTESQISVRIEKEVQKRISNQIMSRDATQQVKMFSIGTAKDLLVAGKLEVKTVEEFIQEAHKIEQELWSMANMPEMVTEKPSRIIS